MSTISRYIIKSLIFPFFMSLGVILFLFIMNIVMKMLTSFVGKGIELVVIIEFFYLSMGWVLALAIPMSVLVATLIAYGRLSQDNEFSVMQSSGLSVFQLLVPSLVLGLLLAWGMMGFHNYVLPEMNHKNKVIKQSIKRKKPLAIIEPGIFINDISGFVLKVDSVDHIKNNLYKVLIVENKRNAKFRRTITADRGKINYDSNTNRYIIQLQDGEIANLDTKKPDGYTRAKFKKMIITKEVKGVDFEVSQNNYYGDREKSVDSLRAKIAKLKKNKASLKTISSVEVEYYKKYALAFSCFIMVLIGAPLGLMSGKGGLGASSSSSFLVFIIYYFFLTAGERFADRGMFDPLIAMWNANFFIGLLGLFLIYKASRGTKLSFTFVKDFYYIIKNKVGK